jgi:hypothetical protein
MGHQLWPIGATWTWLLIVGYRALTNRDEDRNARIADRPLHEGDALSLDGHSGQVYAGKVSVLVEKPTPYLREVEAWKARRCPAKMTIECAKPLTRDRTAH